MRVAIYTRVSTADQSTGLQRAELSKALAARGWTITAEYTDEGISGAKGRTRRAGLDAMLKAATRREFDAVAAWSLDRLGRSLQDLLAILSELQGARVELYLHRQAIDTSTAAGRALFGMLGVFAEFERAIMVERTRAGQARAKAQGKQISRWPPLSADKIAAVRDALALGCSYRQAAQAAGVSPASVQRIARRP